MDEPRPIELYDDERRIVETILHRHVPDATVWAFGSRVKGRMKRWSDLDLAILAEEPVSPDVMADLREAFADSDLPWKVDLLDWATTAEHFRAIIAPDLRVLVARREAA